VLFNDLQFFSKCQPTSISMTYPGKLFVTYMTNVFLITLCFFVRDLVKSCDIRIINSFIHCYTFCINIFLFITFLTLLSMLVVFLLT